jgi:putative glycosyltransferase (TIGR04372 family)
VKKFIKHFLIYLINPLFKDKKFFYVNPSYLGSLSNLIYLMAINKKVTLILDAKEMLKKNSKINKKIFLIAYEKFNKKKFNTLENYFYYIFFRLVQYDKKYHIFFVKAFNHNDQEVFKNLYNYNKVSFDFKEKIKDENLLDLIKKEILIFHCRDAKFKKNISNNDMSYHNYRNENLTIYENAISRFKHNQNYELLRFGSIGENKCKKSSIFDYTFSNIRNETNDIHLIKNCKVYIGAPSGPDILAMNYQKPIVYINWIHLPNLFTFQKNTVVIFKKIYNKKKKEFISFQNLLNKNYFLNDKKTPVGLYDTSQQYENSELELIHNTEEEIYNAVNEMINFIDGKFKFNSDLQNRFKKIYYKNNNNLINENFFVSEYFIKQNLDLFK